MEDSYSARVAELKQQAAKLQRDKEAVVAGLHKVIADAQGVLRELGNHAAHSRRRRRAVGSGRKRGRPRTGTSTFSAAARKKISMAQKRRWAKVRKAKAAA